jgi:hypothetical protein
MVRSAADCRFGPLTTSWPRCQPHALRNRAQAGSQAPNFPLTFGLTGRTWDSPATASVALYRRSSGSKHFCDLRVIQTQVTSPSSHTSACSRSDTSTVSSSVALMTFSSLVLSSWEHHAEGVDRGAERGETGLDRLDVRQRDPMRDQMEPGQEQTGTAVRLQQQAQLGAVMRPAAALVPRRMGLQRCGLVRGRGRRCRGRWERRGLRRGGL